MRPKNGKVHFSSKKRDCGSPISLCGSERYIYSLACTYDQRQVTCSKCKRLLSHEADKLGDVK